MSPARTPAQRALARWLLRLAVALMLGTALVLVFLLVQATNNRLLYERFYTRLLALNVVAASLLALVIVWGVWRLLLRLRRGKFGSRLLIKLAGIFGLVGVLPGLLIYGVSYQFVSRSIESWFDVKVEGALVSGLTLARTSLDTQARELADQLQTAATELGAAHDGLTALSLERLRQQAGLSEASLWSASGRLLGSTDSSLIQLSPERPPANLLRAVRVQGVVTQIEGMDEEASASAQPARIRALALVSARGIGLLGEPRVLQVLQVLPPTLVAHALAVQEANREYQERALGRHGLRRMYIGTLTLALFLAVFGAVLLAVLLGKQLATPLLMLADGVRQVAAGDLRPKLILQGRDEVSALTRAFAGMTQQLADARAALDASMDQVSAAHAHLQAILDNMSAGVIVLDAQGRVQSSNPGATRILRQPLAASEGLPLAELLPLQDFAAEVQRQFAALEEGLNGYGMDHWQHAFELYADNEGAKTDTVALVVRGAVLPGAQRLLVFDDITEIVSAQRTQAWGEVARRLAHEIKNPLTPIQLSAERLEHRLASKLAEPDRALLAKSVHTIVDQVDALQRLVNEFRDYARLPAAQLSQIDLNELAAQVLHLYNGDPEPGQPAQALPVRFTPDTACPPILGDAQQLRQVIHNLVQNALDASADAGIDCSQSPIEVRTQWIEASQRVRLSVLDCGGGFPDAVLKRAFEPYVTTKAKGTGLGLAVVHKIAQEHHARIDLSNRSEHGRTLGAQVSLTFEPATAQPRACA